MFSRGGDARAGVYVPMERTDLTGLATGIALGQAVHDGISPAMRRQPGDERATGDPGAVPGVVGCR